MTQRRTDYRALKARRDAALARPELREQRPKPIPDIEIARAIAEGRLTKLPMKGRRQVR